MEEEGEEYLERTGVACYLRDAVGLLVSSRTSEPLRFMDDYFQGVLRGENVLMRHFAYVNATTRNRLSFVVAMEEAFGGCAWSEPVAPLDYLQLLRQLCPDFPRPLVSAAAAAILPLRPHGAGQGEGDAVPRADFEMLSLACNLWFFFAEFLDLARLAFERPAPAPPEPLLGSGSRASEGGALGETGGGDAGQGDRRRSRRSYASAVREQLHAAINTVKRRGRPTPPAPIVDTVFDQCCAQAAGSTSADAADGDAGFDGSSTLQRALRFHQFCAGFLRSKELAALLREARILQMELGRDAFEDDEGVAQQAAQKPTAVRSTRLGQSSKLAAATTTTAAKKKRPKKR